MVVVRFLGTGQNDRLIVQSKTVDRQTANKKLLPARFKKREKENLQLNQPSSTTNYARDRYSLSVKREKKTKPLPNLYSFSRRTNDQTT
jgi:hypothetical protein